VHRDRWLAYGRPNPEATTRNFAQWERRSTVREYRLLLITDPDAEQFWPGQSRQLAELVAGRADLIRFTAEEGAAYPCQPTGRLLTENCMFDWLAAFTSV